MTRTASRPGRRNLLIAVGVVVALGAGCTSGGNETGRAPPTTPTARTVPPATTSSAPTVLLEPGALPCPVERPAPDRVELVEPTGPVLTPGATPVAIPKDGIARTPVPGYYETAEVVYRLPAGGARLEPVAHARGCRVSAVGGRPGEPFLQVCAQPSGRCAVVRWSEADGTAQPVWSLPAGSHAAATTDGELVLVSLDDGFVELEVATGAQRRRPSACPQATRPSFLPVPGPVLGWSCSEQVRPVTTRTGVVLDQADAVTLGSSTGDGTRVWLMAANGDDLVVQTWDLATGALHARGLGAKELFRARFGFQDPELLAGDAGASGIWLQACDRAACGRADGTFPVGLLRLPVDGGEPTLSRTLASRDRYRAGRKAIFFVGEGDDGALVAPYDRGYSVWRLPLR